MSRQLSDTFCRYVSTIRGLFIVPADILPQGEYELIMSSISDARVLGGIGSILVLLSAVPNVGWLLGIAGFVMILLAIRNISQTVGDKKIYNNMLTAVILGIGAI